MQIMIDRLLKSGDLFRFFFLSAVEDFCILDMFDLLEQTSEFSYAKKFNTC